MGLGSEFWKILSSVAKVDSTVEGLRRLRGRRLAIDLSYWICQLDGNTHMGGRNSTLHLRLKPHLRNLFFRTIKLAARIGALPIFVVDGDPSPLKLRARIERFSRLQGIPLNSDESNFQKNGGGKRNTVFLERVKDCVELLRLLGMPVLVAQGEAEALCAFLNKKGLVDYCVSPDSDLFLHGARQVIKTLQTDYKAPTVEEYSAEDLVSLKLSQKHLVGLALLLGCDYTKGVKGLGRRQALRLVQSCSEDQILVRLFRWAKGELPLSTEMDGSDGSSSDSANENCQKKSEKNEKRVRKPPHCRQCGHPGTFTEHSKTSCKPKKKGFNCFCTWCVQARKKKKKVRKESWWIKACGKIATTKDFPNQAIVDTYLQSDSTCFKEHESLEKLLKWPSPEINKLEEFLQSHLSFDPDYTKQKLLPLLSHNCLTNMAKAGGLNLSLLDPSFMIYGLYIPVSIQRKKKDYGEMLLVLLWSLASDISKREPENPCVRELFPDCKGKDNNFEDSDEKNEAEKEKGKEKESIGRQGNNDWETGRQEKQGEFTTSELEDLVKAACPQLWINFLEKQEMKNKVKPRKRENGSLQQQNKISSYFSARKKKEQISPANERQSTEKVVYVCTDSHGKGRLGDAQSQSMFLEPLEMRFSGNKNTKEREVGDHCGDKGKTTKSCGVIGVNENRSKNKAKVELKKQSCKSAQVLTQWLEKGNETGTEELKSRESTLQATRDALFHTVDDDQHLFFEWRGEIVGDKNEKGSTLEETKEASQSLKLETSPKPYSFLDILGTVSRKEGRKSAKRKLDMTCFNRDLTKPVDASDYQCEDFRTKRWNHKEWDSKVSSPEAISKTSTVELVELSSDSSSGG